MSKFLYKAKRGPGELKQGIIEAENEESVIDKLNEMGCTPIQIVAAKEGAPVKEESPGQVKKKNGKRPQLFKKITGRQLTLFTEQFSSLVKSKVPILEAVNILQEQTENVYMKAVIAGIYRNIKEGGTLAQALKKYPKVFSPLYVNMVHTGEVGGVLDEILTSLVEFRNKEEEVKSKVTSSLAYPAFMLVVGILTVVVLLTFVIPRLTSLFSDMGQELPLPTKILISLSSSIKKYWIFGAAAAAGGVLLFKRRGISKKEKEAVDRLILRVPLLGGMVQKTLLTRFSRTLSLLLSSGIPLFEAMEVSIPTISNEVFRGELDKVRQAILEGSSLEQSFKKTVAFPNFMINILVVGERGGRLKDALLEVANFYDRDIDRATKVMTSLIEPVIILGMGLVVGFIVFAMILPIFQMNMG